MPFRIVLEKAESEDCAEIATQVGIETRSRCGVALEMTVAEYKT